MREDLTRSVAALAARESRRVRRHDFAVARHGRGDQLAQ
jgi:hypothetical protein